MRALTLVGVLVLTGCTSMLPQPPIAIDTLKAIKSFELKGRVAIRNNGQGFSGSLKWHHQPKIDKVEIYGPLSQTVAQISKDDQQVRLVTADQKEFRAVDTETLTEEVIGWRLPLQGLQHWVLGIPQPGIPAELKHDLQQRVVYLAQSGWRIEFQRYHVQRGLPDRLTLRYGDDLEIRLIIDQWSVDPL